MRNILATAVIVAVAAGAAVADEVTLNNGLSYPDVRITAYDDGQLTFQTAAGARVSKSLADDIKLIQVGEKPRFNRAETLLAEGKADQAIDAYDTAADHATGWLAELIPQRRLMALDAAGRIDQAAREWIALAKTADGAAWALKLRPSQLGEKGSAVNDAAINALEAQMDRVENEDLRAAMKGLLLSLYKVEGRGEAAGELASEFTAGGGEDAPVTGLDAQLQGAGVLLEQDRAEEALRSVRDNLSNYTPAQLSQGLLIAGKARLALAEEAPAATKRDLLLQAGLDLMRIATYYPEAAEAAEALYLVGTIHEQLSPPNRTAATNAYVAVTERYPNSAWAQKARAALDGMK